MLIASPASGHAPLAPRPVRDVGPVVLLDFLCARQLRVLGLLERLDVVGALDLDLTLGWHFMKRREETLLTIIVGRDAWCGGLTGTGS